MTAGVTAVQLSNRRSRRSKHLFHGLARERNNREDAENCSKGNEETFDTSHYQCERIMFAAGKTSTGNQDTNRHRDPEQKQKQTHDGKNPAKKFRQQLFTWLRRPMSRSEYENCADLWSTAAGRKKTAPPSQLRRNEKSQATADALCPGSFAKQLATLQVFTR